MPNLDEIADFLDQQLTVDREQYPNDQNGIYRSSSRPIQRLGLALEPSAEWIEWVDRTQPDALFLHRPWTLDLSQIAADIGIVTYHLAFDERLTLGFNPTLAAALDMTGLEILGTKHDRPIGMIGDRPAQSFADWRDRLHQIFSGVEQVYACEGSVSRVAVVGAMTDALIREAANRGADGYVTGQIRQAAAAAVQETGLGVIAIGHQRCEAWGLKVLAEILSDRWADLHINLFQSSQHPG